MPEASGPHDRRDQASYYGCSVPLPLESLLCLRGPPVLSPLHRVTVTRFLPSVIEVLWCSA